MTALREEVARAIAYAMVGGHPSKPKLIDYSAADAVIPIILGRAADHVGSIPPRTFAYRYGDGWRFNTGAREINGSRPTEAQALVTQEFVVAAIRQVGRGE